jgi:hypothetical protein
MKSYPSVPVNSKLSNISSELKNILNSSFSERGRELYCKSLNFYNSENMINEKQFSKNSNSVPLYSFLQKSNVSQTLYSSISFFSSLMLLPSSLFELSLIIDNSFLLIYRLLSDIYKYCILPAVNSMKCVNQYTLFDKNIFWKKPFIKFVKAVFVPDNKISIISHELSDSNKNKSASYSHTIQISVFHRITFRVLFNVINSYSTSIASSSLSSSSTSASTDIFSFSPEDSMLFNSRHRFFYPPPKLWFKMIYSIQQICSSLRSSLTEIKKVELKNNDENEVKLKDLNEECINLYDVVICEIRRGINFFLLFFFQMICSYIFSMFIK